MWVKPAGLSGKKKQLKYTIIAPMVLVIMLGFTASWLLYLTASRDAVENILQKLVSEVSERIIARTELILETARSMAITEAGMLKTMHDPSLSVPSLRRSFHNQIAKLDGIGIVSAGFETGDYAEAQRLADGTIRTGWAGAASGGTLEIWNADANGHPVSLALKRENYDPRKRPWYSTAVDRDAAGWSEIYSYVSTSDLAISASAPFSDDDKKLLGVCSVTVSLSGISLFLSSLPEAGRGVIGIVDSENRLIAVSNGTPVRNAEGTSRIAASDSVSVDISTAARLMLVKDSMPGDRQIEEGNWVGFVSGLDPARYPEWRVFILVDKSDYLKTLAGTDLNTAFVLVFTLFLSLAIGWYAVSRVTEPLGRLKTAALDLEPGFGNDAHGEVVSALSLRKDEIGGLAEAFSGMSKRLEKTFRSLNASVAEKEILLREVHHRVKNNLQIVASILNLQASETDDERLTTALEVCQDRIQSMAFLYEDIYQSESFSSIDMESYLGKICDTSHRSRSIGMPDIVMEVNVKGITLSIEKAIPCGLIVNELVMNAISHACSVGGKGHIRVGMERDGNTVILAVSDDGLERESPLSVSETGNGGLGSHLTKILISQLKGNPIQAEGFPAGTSIIIRFPD